MKNFLKMIGIGVALILVATTGYAQTLTVGSASGTQGQTITIPVNFTNDTNNVVGLQFDVTFDTGLLIVTADPAKGSALTNINVYWGASYGDGFAKVIVSTTDLTPLPSGEIARLTISIVSASGTAKLQLSDVVMSDTDGNSVKPAALNSGTISVTDDGGVVPPPSKQLIAPCDATCQENAPMKYEAGAVDVNFNYTGNVEIIAGLLNKDFSRVWWLTYSCIFSTDYAQALHNAMQLSCNNVILPSGADGGYLFWLVAPSVSANFGSNEWWTSGVYELMWYQFP